MRKRIAGSNLTDEQKRRKERSLRYRLSRNDIVRIAPSPKKTETPLENNKADAKTGLSHEQVLHLDHTVHKVVKEVEVLDGRVNKIIASWAMQGMAPLFGSGKDKLDLSTWLRLHGLTIGLCLFVLLNTTFLVFQQYSVYLAAGYSFIIAISAALLMEIALVLQSALFACTRGFGKVFLAITTAITLFVVAQLLHTGVLTKTSAAMAHTTESETIRRRIATLEELEANSILTIKSLDAKTYPSKIELLKNALKAPGGYSYEIAQLQKELFATTQSSAQLIIGQTEALVSQQWLLLLLNIIFAHFIGRRIAFRQ